MSGQGNSSNKSVVACSNGAGKASQSDEGLNDHQVEVDVQINLLDLYALKYFTWRSPSMIVKNKVPLPRSGHRIINDGVNLYSFGGYLEAPGVPNPENNGVPVPNIVQQTLFNELWSFNMTDDQWQLHPTTGEHPTELASFSAVRHGHFLVVFGGTGIPFGDAASNRMHVCDLRNKVWELVETTGTPPTPLYGQGVLMVDDYFYTVGGTTGFTYSIDVHRLNLKTFIWEELYVSVGNEYDDPEKRYRHELVYDGDLLYVLGGGTANTTCKLEILPAFNVQDKVWYSVHTKKGADGIPSPRKCQGVVQLGKDVYMCGGFDNQRIYLDLWNLNLKDRVWTLIPVYMPLPLYFHGCTVTDAGCMFVFGGVSTLPVPTTLGQVVVRSNRVFSIWLKVPSLQELAWDTLLASSPQLKTTKRATLLGIGIPAQFAERLSEHGSTIS